MPAEAQIPKPIPHHEWDLHDHASEPETDVDQATEAYEAAQRIIGVEEAKPTAAHQTDEDAEYDRLDNMGGHFRAGDIRHKSGLED
jgi:hypothetical protein